MKNIPYPEQIAEKKILTHCEKVIYSCLLTDMTRPEIATKVCVSARTVAFHCEHIYKKLGVRNRVGLVLKHYEGGIEN